MTDIDKIYEMLSWDNSVRTQNKGIKKANKIKSLYVIILPILPCNSKCVWENCAKVLCQKSISELNPYLTEILKWLQDMNWPGASLIYDKLLTIPYDNLRVPLKICISMAQNSNDVPWLKSLSALESELQPSIDN